jgi:hypothetical protein
MMAFYRISFFSVFLLLLSGSVNAQALSPDQLKPDPQKEKMYLPYLATRHGGPEGLAQWKSSNTIQYYKELWYFCESFSVKRDHLPEGLTLDESIIDITRFEHLRKNDEPAVVVLPGFRDALVLKPGSQLIHKPAY